MPKLTENRLAHFNRTPPIAVRAAAVKHKQGGPKGTRVERIPMEELLASSGIPRRTFQKLSYRTDWNGVPVDIMCSFCAACGVDIIQKRPLYEFLRQHGKKKLSFLTTRQRLAMDEAIRKKVENEV